MTTNDMTQVEISRANKLLQQTIYSIIGVVVFLIIWEISSTFLFPEKAALPSPYKVAVAVSDMWHSGELSSDVIASLSRILLGFAIAFIVAAIFGIIAARYAKIYDFIKTMMDLLSSIPPIAWTPVAILWFGIGNTPAYFIVFLGAFFPMFTSIYHGITSVDNQLINAAKALGATPLYVVRAVVFPSALPQILTGMKTGIGVAWFNVIAAELIGVRSGLGYKIQLNRTLLFSDNVIGIMLIIGALGFIMTRTVAVAGNITAPWAIQSETRNTWIHLQQQVIRIFGNVHGYLCKSKIDLKDNNSTALYTRPLQEATQPPVLVINNISKSFQGQMPDENIEVLKNISFSVNPNEVFAILGPNGSGKTTIVNIIAGLLKPDAGNIEFMGEHVDVPSHQRTVVFQDFALFPWLTCKGNIMFALKASAHEGGGVKQPYVERARLAAHFLNEAYLDEFANTYPMDLSGGMKQRLALVRALAVSPKLILMDEPFASFDPIVREKSQEAILDLLARHSTTILLVTHDLDEAIFMADRIMVLSARPGIIREIIDVNLPRPRISGMRGSQQFLEFRTHLLDLLRN